MRRIVVTGGCGFIGAHLVRRLIAEGIRVHVVDDLSSGSREALPPDATLTVTSTLDAGVMTDLLSEADGVVHLAAIASVPACQQNPFGSHAVNQSAFVHILNAARSRVAQHPLRIVYASSAAVYGDASAELRVTEDTAKAPLSNYGVDKLAMELHASAATAMWGVDSIALRFFNVYGPGQDPNSPYSGVISRFVGDIAHSGCGSIFGDGLQSRDFIHVHDVVAGIVAALQRTADGAEAFNLCTGIECTILELHRMLTVALGQPAEPRFLPARTGEIRRSVGDCSRAEKLLGFAPLVSLPAGLAGLAKR